MYRTLRIISVIIVTASAYLGIQYDFKSNGLFTDKGVIVICLVIFSGLAAIILEILEHKRQKKEDIERQKQFENLKYQLSKPILPLNFRCVLKYTTKEEIINNIFGKDIESFKLLIDFFKDKGKFIHPGLADFPWDEDHQTNEYILCTLENDILQKLSKDNHRILKSPFSGTLEFFKKQKNGFSNNPDLVLEVGSLFQKSLPYTITDVRLYNKNVYLESYIHQWLIKINTDDLISIYDLRGARLKVKLKISTYDEDDFTKSIPYFTLIQFKCGERPYNLFTLDHNLLGKPKIKKNETLTPSEDEVTKEMWANELSLNYDIVLPDIEFEKYLEQFN